MRLVFIGPPGAGKGTQARRLLEHLRIPHLSTGDILRNAIARGDSLGIIGEHYMSQGQLVPDELVMQVVERRLEQGDCQLGCLFDGFPRTMRQAESLDELLGHMGSPLKLVLELRGEHQELAKRMVARAAMEGRADDIPETIAKRFEVYFRQTMPLIAYYARSGILVTIDAMQSPDDVFRDIRSAVDSAATAIE